MDALMFLKKALAFEPGHAEETLIQFKGSEKPVKTQARKLPKGQVVFTISYTTWGAVNHSAAPRATKRRHETIIDALNFQSPDVLEHVIGNIESVLTLGLCYGRGESPVYSGVYFNHFKSAK